MWGSVFKGLTNLCGLWFKTKQAKALAEIKFRQKLAESEADWDLVAQQQAANSWKDELITIVWFSPLIVAWFEPERADHWVQWVGDLPPFYQFGMFGIISASFGLRWFFKQQGFKLQGAKK